MARLLEELIEEGCSHECQFVLAYAVYQGGHERSFGDPHWFFTDKEEAYAVASGKGSFGGNAYVGKHLAVKVGDDYYLLEGQGPILMNQNPDDQDKIRNGALLKLTPAEKRALGLTEIAKEKEGSDKDYLTGTGSLTSEAFTH